MGATGGEPSEEELRAAYEAELKKVRVEDLLADTVVNMVNFGMRRTGLVRGTEDERDAAQVRLAIESVRALLPLLETAAPQQTAAIREALTQLQFAFVKIGGAAPEPSAGASGSGAASGSSASERTGGAPSSAPSSGEAPAPAEPSEPPKPGDPGPAQRSGRLWVPGR